MASRALAVAAGWAPEAAKKPCSELHEDPTWQPPRWLNSGRDNGSLPGRDRHGPAFEPVF